MSVPKPHTTWGTLLYDGKEYGVLSLRLRKDILQKIDELYKKKDIYYTSAPWMNKIDWCIENGRLYLQRLYSDEIHKIVFGDNEKVFADWMSEMKVLAEHREICKTYEKRGSVLNEMEGLKFRFDHGRMIDEERYRRLYMTIKTKDYIERPYSFSSTCIDAGDLKGYLYDGKAPKGDLLYPFVYKLMAPMLEKAGRKNEFFDTKASWRNFLELGDRVSFVSGKGKDIEELVGSLVITATEEVLRPKACIASLAAHESVSEKKIEKIFALLREQLNIPKSYCCEAEEMFIELREDGVELGEGEVAVKLLCVV